MSTIPQSKGKSKTNWAPYLLILPTLIYLAVFFAWPMVRGLSLAVWDDEALLSLQAEASTESDAVGTLPQGTTVDILDQQGNKVPLEDIEEEMTEQVALLESQGKLVEAHRIKQRTMYDIEMLRERNLVLGGSMDNAIVLDDYRILNEDGLRWIMHMLIFAGIGLLVLLHACDDLVTVKLFPDYVSTLNPFFFLRNFLGVMVVAGLLIAATTAVLGQTTRPASACGEPEGCKPAPQVIDLAICLGNHVMPLTVVYPGATGDFGRRRAALDRERDTTSGVDHERIPGIAHLLHQHPSNVAGRCLEVNLDQEVRLVHLRAAVTASGRRLGSGNLMLGDPLVVRPLAGRGEPRRG